MGQKLLKNSSPKFKIEPGGLDDSKADKDGWLPLWVHLEDAQYCAEWIWKNRTPRSISSLIIDDLGINHLEAGRLYQLFAVLHDVGKFSPGFYKNKMGQNDARVV